MHYAQGTSYIKKNNEEKNIQNLQTRQTLHTIQNIQTICTKNTQYLRNKKHT